MNSMKRIITLFITIICVSSLSLYGQRQKKSDWKEKMRTEKIAFLTSEINLSVEEAQNFWPIYNRISTELDRNMRMIKKSYMELRKATEGGDEGAIEAALEKYLFHLSEQDRIANASYEEYKKALPVEKIAKLYLAEEKFRRQQIHKLHKKEDNNKTKQRDKNPS